MKKKIISLLMALCMLTTVMTVCSVNAFAEEISNSFFSQKVRARAGETVTVTFSASTTDDFRAYSPPPRKNVRDSFRFFGSIPGIPLRA